LGVNTNKAVRDVMAFSRLWKLRSNNILSYP